MNQKSGRGSVVRLTLFASLIILFIPPAQTQSLDEVHVVPRTSDAVRAPADGPASTATRTAEHKKPLRVAVDLVLVPVTVTDALNQPVVNLERGDFKVYEDGRQQSVQSFSKEDAPISVGLILDFSNSMGNKFETERSAVTEFFNNAHPQDDYFAIAFSDRPMLISDSTQSIDELQQRLSATIPTGKTALLDAIYLGVAQLRAARYQRRVLLIISDGGDNHSRYNARETRRMAEEAGVLMYSIGIFDDMPIPVFKTIEEKMGKRLLTDITEVTGGRTVAADNRNKVPEIAASVSRELRQSYVLAYRSDDSRHDGKWRKIKVQVTASAPQRLHLYYKKGYIAPSE